MSSNLELIINPSTLENCVTAEPGVMAFSDRSSSFFDHHHHQQQQQPQLCMNFNNINNDYKNIQSLGGLASEDHFSHAKAAAHAVESFVNLSSPPVSATGFCVNNNKSLISGRKRKRSNERVMMEKPKEVIHVRAKRGQATDSHSLAERVRREKINERLRCLQDLVPGCYKTMGMAVMLDVIINYVRSLQNQIEFLSMKLSAASMYYDFNSELDATETMLETNEYEVQDIERMVREGCYGGPSCFHSTWSL